MEVIRHQRIGQDTHAAKGLQPAHQQHKSFGLGRAVASSLENESTVNHSGNAVVKTLPLSLDARGTSSVWSNLHTKHKDVSKNRILYDI